MPFRINAKNFFITYPQSDNLSNEKIKNFFEQLGATSYTISRELHQDGHAHHHAIISFRDAFSSRNERIFDIEGFHPNIQPARNMRNVRDYVRKAGDYITSGEDDTGPRRYADLLNTPSREEYWELARREYPRDVILHYERLEYTAEKLFEQTNPTYTNPYPEYNTTNEGIQQWMNEEFNKVIRWPSAEGVIEPPSRRSSFFYRIVIWLRTNFYEDRQTKNLMYLWTKSTGKNCLGKISGETYLLERNGGPRNL